MPNTKKAIATEFITNCAHGHSHEAFQKHIHPNFVHHNPNFHGNAEELMKAMEDQAKAHPRLKFHIVHLIQENDMIMVHSRMTEEPGSDEFALVHLFKFDADKIVELWDISQPAPKKIINENGMF